MNPELEGFECDQLTDVTVQANRQFETQLFHSTELTDGMDQ